LRKTRDYFSFGRKWREGRMSSSDTEARRSSKKSSDGASGERTKKPVARRAARAELIWEGKYDEKAFSWTVLTRCESW
jgi:hypothetical protein